MQAQSRFAVSGSSSNSVSAHEHEAVIWELMRGHELTAQLRAEALRVLRGQGQVEATAALILQEVSRAFTVCLSIMSSPARAPAGPPTPPEMPEQGVTTPATAARRNRDENVQRKQTLTSTPHLDGHQWRKYGQKWITNTNFPRCYYRCSNHRERSCPATKRVQQRSNGDPPVYVVIYVNEHTCNTPAWEPEEAVPGATNPPLELSGLTKRQQGARCALLDERGVQEEHERQALVSSLACVLGGQCQSPPGGIIISSSDVALAQEHQKPQGRSTRDASASAPAPAVSVAGAPELLPPLDADEGGLDVMDYDVMGGLCFGDSYGLSDDGLQF